MFKKVEYPEHVKDRLGDIKKTQIKLLEVTKQFLR